MKLNDKFWSILNIRSYLLLVNSILLMAHIILTLTFASLNATLLAYYDIASVIVYLLSYATIRKGKYSTYIVVACLEILIQTVLAILFLGWDVGFQVYGFLLIPMTFFSVYMGFSSPRDLIFPMIASVVDIAAYVFCFNYCNSHLPVYYGLLSEEATRSFYLINTVIVYPSLISLVGFFVVNAAHAEAVLHRMAECDELTGLKNRRFIMNHIKKTCEAGEEILAVAIADIDDFKKINDTYGHDAGDYVLKTLGKRIKAALPDNAEVGRWGGEEFIFIFRGSGGSSCEAMERIRGEIEKNNFSYEGRSIKITLTVGFAESEPEKSIGDVIKKADDRLYDGKSSGKNMTVSK